MSPRDCQYDCQCMDISRCRLAYHEAGHAWFLLYHCVLLEQISIRSNEDTAGRVEFNYGFKEPESMVIAYLAGPCAEMVYLEGALDIEHACGASRDYQACQDLARNKMRLSGEAAKSWIRGCYQTTFEFVQKNWSEIDALAQVLLLKEELFSDDIERFLDALERAKK